MCKASSTSPTGSTGSVASCNMAILYFSLSIWPKGRFLIRSAHQGTVQTGGSIGAITAHCRSYGCIASPEIVPDGIRDTGYHDVRARAGNKIGPKNRQL